uniref:Uncharacterized protein n=1 Tax=Anguilla anguilla TaxID=7936 RepID=A0A0E9U784_ANGAN
MYGFVLTLCNHHILEGWGEIITN